jgi:DNA (cytosine-5)-methyltransferase 1
MGKLDFIDRDTSIKDPPDFTVVSTFAGCGGSSTGYVWAGGKVLLAVEWDNNAVEVYHLNHPHTPIYHGDIAKLSVDACLERTGLRPGELDILDGSPPCQGFSVSGKRQIDDPRNQLFREFVRLLAGLKPKVFVMENVAGLVKGKMKLVFAEVLTELRDAGYRVSARLMNTAYFGVPQSRPRLIFVGVRDDLGIEPSHPKAQTQPITVREAWEGVLEEPAPYVSPKLRSFMHLVPAGEAGDAIFSKRSYFSTRRLTWDKPSPTITKSDTGTRCGIIHPQGGRLITIAEMKRLQSFPDCYRFTGGYRRAAERIGNSVPPRFMQAVAEHIRDEILGPARA